MSSSGSIAAAMLSRKHAVALALFVALVGFRVAVVRAWHQTGGDAGDDAALPRRGVPDPGDPGGVRRDGAQPRTYSNSNGWPLMPRVGGAIQPAILPGSCTGFISDSM